MFFFLNSGILKENQFFVKKTYLNKKDCDEHKKKIFANDIQGTTKEKIIQSTKKKEKKLKKIIETKKSFKYSIFLFFCFQKNRVFKKYRVFKKK